MQASDVAALDELLAADLTFTTHDGRVISKSDDLHAHRSGAFTIHAVTLTGLDVRHEGDVAVTTVNARIRASAGGTTSEDNFRFIRVWRRVAPGAWRVWAGQSTPVSEWTDGTSDRARRRSFETST